MRRIHLLSLICASLGLSVLGCANGICRQVKHPELAERAGAAGSSVTSAVAAPTSNAPAGVSRSDLPSSANTPATARPEASLQQVQRGTSTESVFVFKPDGGLQCGKAAPLSVQAMKSQLQDIPVFSSANRPDSRVHIQMCGAPTGMINVYEIPSNYLSEALKRGFKKLEIKP